MTKSKNTKKALLLSVLSVLVCIAMLVGSTFAWFTDSVTSGKNVIKSGNLDISAVYQDVTATPAPGAPSYTIPGFDKGAFSFGAEVDINENNAIIDEKLWEPGATGAKLITVKNNGSLAAKIKLAFDVSDAGLQEALWFDFVKVENGAAVGTFTKRPMSQLKAFSESLELPLLSKENVSFILLYGMNEEAGNEYMNKSFSAGVTILAKQHTFEKDSFNDQYDKNAVYPIIEAKDTNELVQALVAGGTVILTQNIDIAPGEIEPLTINKDTVLRLDSHTLDVTGVGTSVKDKIIIKDGATLTIDAKETGKISYSAGDTTPRLFSVGKGSKLVINGGNFVITKTGSRKDGQGIYLDEGCTFEMNGGSISAEGSALNLAGNNCNVTINGGTLLSRNGDKTVVISPGSNFVMNDGKVIMQNESYAFSSAFGGGRNAGTTVINGGHVIGPIAFNLAQNQKVTVNGGTIESARLNYGSVSGTLLTINGGNIIGTGTDAGGEPAVVLDKGNVELRGGTYMPNYLYGCNGTKVKLFKAVYNGSNPPAYGTDDKSVITFDPQ